MSEINKQEEKMILDVVEEVWRKVKARCSNLDDWETSAALYSIQDFLGSIDVNEDGVNDKLPREPQGRRP